MGWLSLAMNERDISGHLKGGPTRQNSRIGWGT